MIYCIDFIISAAVIAALLTPFAVGGYSLSAWLKERRRARRQAILDRHWSTMETAVKLAEQRSEAAVPEPVAVFDEPAAGLEIAAPVEPAQLEPLMREIKCGCPLCRRRRELAAAPFIIWGGPVGKC